MHTARWFPPVRRPRQIARVAGLLLLGLFLAGCSQKADWAATQRQADTPAGDLYAEHTVGQTFVASHAGLDAVEVLLVDYGPDSSRATAPLEFRLCEDMACQEVITHTTLPVASIVHNAPYRLRFPRQADSAGRTFILQVSAPRALYQAQATVWASGSDYYPDGTLLRDGQPAEGDLSFDTFYTTDAWQLARRLWGEAGAGLGAVPALLLLLLAPGYLLARCLPRSREDDVLDLLASAIALSVAAVPVLLLLLSLLGPLLSGWAIRLGGSALGVAALGLFVWDLRRGRWRGLSRIPAPVWFAAAGILTVGFVLRAVHALDLAGPPWVDAVHHSLLARLIIERQAIPGDYLPYAEVAPATYHFGFQSLVAVLNQLTGRSLPDCLLLLGQVLSGLAGLPLYTLGKRWGGSRWGGLLAAAVPAGLSLMPAYYISWSRYTELAGLLILPLAVVLLERWLRMRRWHWGGAAVTAVALAGLLVTHTRVAAFLAVLAALLVIETVLRWRYTTAWVPVVRALVVALAAAVLVWPWLGPSIQYLWLPAANTWPVAAENLSLYYVLYGPGRYVAPIIAAGAALGLFWRRRETLLLALWVGILPLLANPGLVGLQPGGPLDRLMGLRLGAVVDDTAIAIALYIPLSIAAALAGGGAAHLARWLSHRVPRTRWAERLANIPQRLRQWADSKGWRRRGPVQSRRLRLAIPNWRWAAAVLLIALCAWGAYQLRDVVNQRTILLTPSDLQAMAWIRENTTPDDLFLINSYEWMAHVYAGTDGGYWISPLTGRRTWPPSALYGLGTGGYITRINGVVQTANDSTDGETLYGLLRAHGINYVYLGRYGGTLTPERLLSYPRFRLLYHRDGVWIFSLAEPGS